MLKMKKKIFANQITWQVERKSIDGKNVEIIGSLSAKKKFFLDSRNEKKWIFIFIFIRQIHRSIRCNLRIFYLKVLRKFFQIFFFQFFYSIPRTYSFSFHAPPPPPRPPTIAWWDPKSKIIRSKIYFSDKNI